MAAELFSTSLPHGEEEEEEEEVETKTNFIQLSEPEQSAERNDDRNAVHVNNNNDNEDGGEERHSWQGAHPTLRERWDQLTPIRSDILTRDLSNTTQPPAGPTSYSRL
ncbi:hypothetical protein GOODEAATRI_025229 [Goodea atripinnis]|uniref:Uncharacterized protein n=1 Tax=Goodea atripinnis TaxID=208336 RepID=A0ABV0NDF2_9TELE